MVKMKTVFIATALAAQAPLANYAIQNVGTLCVVNGPCLVPVGFGFYAPSGAVLIGAGLALRDILHDSGATKILMASLTVGTVASFMTSNPALAIASASAFLVAESADWAVYALARWGKPARILLSGIVGSAVDSTVFSIMAFGTVRYAPGLYLAKMYASLAYASFSYFRRRA